jgi:hypothetical protein
MNDERPQVPVTERIASTDHQTCGAALRELLPECTAAVLIRCDGSGHALMTFYGLEVPALFALLLSLTQQAGKQVGLDLDWTRHARAPGKELVIPTAMPPLPPRGRGRAG